MLEITVGYWSFFDEFQHLADQNPFSLANFPVHLHRDSYQYPKNNLVFKKWLTNFWSLFLALKQYWHVWIHHLLFLSLQGHGDTSGGCRCRVNKKKCHPQCGNCHWQTAHHAEHGKCFVDSFLFVNELHSDWIF